MNGEDDKKLDGYNVLDVLGVTGLNRQAGLVNEEWLRQLKGSMDKTSDKKSGQQTDISDKHS